jgi:hypothetical protein
MGDDRGTRHRVLDEVGKEGVGCHTVDGMEKGWGREEVWERKRVLCCSCRSRVSADPPWAKTLNRESLGLSIRPVCVRLG